MRPPEFGRLGAFALAASPAPARPIAPTRPSESAASIASPGMPASGGFASVFASLTRDIEGTLANGFGSPALVDDTYGAAAAAMPGGIRAGEAQLAGLALAGSLDARRQAFLDEIMPFAADAAKALGTSPRLVAAHAALESGWGSKPLTTAAGTTTHNLFGIKATANWRGASADAATTEHVDGQDVKTTGRFRAYPDYASAFRDYAEVLAGSPRYAQAVGAGDDARSFARALRRGGYATDPAYEDKLVRVARQIDGIAR
ncbi:glycoside hydrolase family 73 protein [Burkholderia sp. Ac-20379]|uniref:glycoside hydrolase family 73 protein n=1 Tax=Burkholderia sp. Ac-20379 TaxID=2703900 RepID=UPI001F11FB72|nr:glucosaminidase domain-containing protein [Burkholderia sp. Ac-20379]